MAGGVPLEDSQRAPPQGGILDGLNPSVYNPNDPIVLFIIQATIIIVLCRLLHYPLSLARQPRVIAEVVGGIILGPSVMGRIPGFTDAIFPQASKQGLSLAANLGLILFLFLVGLEVDLRFLMRNWKVATSVAIVGMVVPFGLGAAIAYGLYNTFNDEPGIVPVSFGIYMLFIGVAMAITAFPVLCRILTELKLLMTPVGIITVSAGVANDVVGWVLLALCVALVNASSGLTALWVLLTCAAFILFLVYAVRPVFLYVVRRSRSSHDGPSPAIIALTLLICLGSAFFTAIIGVHAIFGAFLAGLICPHERGFAIKVTEKIEDLVATLFLPLFFSLSGLNTNLGLLDSGIAWAYVIGVTGVAFVSKFFGAAVAARASGLVWRESFAIGSLFSCKGLVELIVLNIGLQARILSPRTFTIFVIMALVTTFITTPLTTALYPPWYQKKIELWKRGEIDWTTGAGLTPGGDDSSGDGSSATGKPDKHRVRRLLVYLRLDNMPSLLAFVSVLGGLAEAGKPKPHPAAVEKQDEGSTAGNASTPDEKPRKPIQAHGLRLLELTERGSSVMMVSEMDEFVAHDPVVNIFRSFALMNNVAVSGEVAVVPESSFAETIANRASETLSDLIVVPWSETGTMIEQQVISTTSTQNKLAASEYADFVKSIVSSAPCTTAVFVNNGFGGTNTGQHRERPRLMRSASALSIGSTRDTYDLPVADRSHHVLMLFFGGPNDRAAARLVLQMAENPEVTATIVHFLSISAVNVTEAESGADADTEQKKAGSAQRKEHGGLSAASSSDATFFETLQSSASAALASKVVFESRAASASASADEVVAYAKTAVGLQPKNAGDLIVLGRHSGLRGSTGHQTREGVALSLTAAGTCLGGLAEALLIGKVRASLLVVQAMGKGTQA